MSFITYDFKCQKCGNVEERFVRRSEVGMQFCDCVKGGAAMDSLPPAPITTFKFGDRSAQKGKKAVSLRDPHGNAKSKDHSSSL